MEYALWGEWERFKREPGVVLILILMEYAQWVVDNFAEAKEVKS